MGLIRDELSPASVVGRNHVGVSLLEGPEGSWGESDQPGDGLGEPPDSSGAPLSSKEAWWKPAMKKQKAQWRQCCKVMTYVRLRHMGKPGTKVLQGNVPSFTSKVNKTEL